MSFFSMLVVKIEVIHGYTIHIYIKSQVYIHIYTKHYELFSLLYFQFINIISPNENLPCVSVMIITSY